LTTRVIAVANHKGGVGKTTTTINLGAALAEVGQRVLLVDLDPQRSTTRGLGIDSDACAATMYHVLVKDTPIVGVAVPVDGHLAVAPASTELADAMVELWDAPARDLRLRNQLEDVHGAYDAILVDCPPSLNLFTINALIAAGEVVIPVQSQFFAMDVLAELLDTVAAVRRHANRRLRVAGFVVNQLRARTTYHRQALAHLHAELGDAYRIFAAAIPDSIRIQEAAQARLPLVRYDPSSSAATAYRQLAQEVLAQTPDS
jgi:chromosome partitioning protein